MLLNAINIVTALLEYIAIGLGRLASGDDVEVGMDSCVLPTRHHGYYLVQTTDLYPSVVIIMSYFCCLDNQKLLSISGGSIFSGNIFNSVWLSW